MAAETVTNGTNGASEANGTKVADGATETNGTTTTKSLAPEGSLPSHRSLYGTQDQDQRWTWLDKEPQDVPPAAENEETAQHAIITRLRKAEDSRKKYEIHSIIVQSPWLKYALGEIFEGYPGVHCGLKRLVFEAPFTPFVHRWNQFNKYRARDDLDGTTAKHLAVLHDVLCDELKEVIKTFEDAMQHGVITYEHIWTIFQPGEIIYSNAHHGATGAMKLTNGRYVKTQCGMAYQIMAQEVDWTGRVFGRKTEFIRIFEFLGLASILGLKAFPLSFHPQADKIREKLIARGKKFEELAGCHYKGYEGFAITWDREGNEVPIYCSGRIIVDSDTFDRFSNYHHPHIEPMQAKEGVSEPACAGPTLDLAIKSKGEGETTNPEKYEFGQHVSENRMRLTPDHQLICTSRVRGYSFKKKQWLEFYVDLIQDISFNDNAFDALVLPEDQKELILSFAESQAMHSTAFDDVISGKGRGHITLLSGPPGVGKTLTAESVAEHMKAPLYMMSAGDLGINPDEVETRLNNILEMIAKWNAVLLLDECDVFLEKRSAHDLERNKLVSIFLRVLEYYEGILFLTTNRVDNIDLAFQSRIHVSMSYPDLTDESRRIIWQNFLEGLGVGEGKGGWTKEDLDELATVKLNGRQIKNVLKSAALLSARKKEGLGRRYVDMVLAIENRRPGVADSF